MSGGGIGDSQETVGGGHGFFDVRFKLRELDGTPVDLILDSESPVAVPEPPTVLLLVGSLVSLVLARALSRCRRERGIASM